MPSLIEARRQHDLLLFNRAREVAPYADDSRVAELTEAVMATGARLLHAFRPAADDRESVKQLLAMIRPAYRSRLLDLGCGIGAFAEHVRAIRPDLDLGLVNVSPAQLRHCPAGFRLVHADFHSVPLPPGGADAAVFLFSIGHAVLHRALPEARRLLRRGGVLFIWDMTSPRPADVVEVLGYQPHPPTRVFEEAAAAGFRLDRCVMPTRADDSLFVQMLGADRHQELLGDAMPIAYRFIAEGA